MDKITKETILKGIDQLRGSLRGVEESIFSAASSPAISMPAVILIEDRKKGLLYGDYQGLSSLGYCPDDLEVKGRDIVLKTYYQTAFADREKQYAALENGGKEAICNLVYLQALDGGLHAFCEILSLFNMNGEGRKEKLMVALINLSTSLFAQPKLETLIYKAIWSSITRREKQIIEMAARGMKSSDIAKELDIAVGTVEKHRKNLNQKLGVDNVGSLVQVINNHNLS
jgi:DNA-binding CsgD family transcriptional regulator